MSGRKQVIYNQGGLERLQTSGCFLDRKFPRFAAQLLEMSMKMWIFCLRKCLLTEMERKAGEKQNLQRLGKRLSALDSILQSSSGCQEKPACVQKSLQQLPPSRLLCCSLFDLQLPPNPRLNSVSALEGKVPQLDAATRPRRQKRRAETSSFLMQPERR